MQHIEETLAFITDVKALPLVTQLTLEQLASGSTTRNNVLNKRHRRKQKGLVKESLYYSTALFLWDVYQELGETEC